MTINTFEIRTTNDVRKVAKGSDWIMFTPGTTPEWRCENERVTALIRDAETKGLITRCGLSTIAADLAGKTVGVWLPKIAATGMFAARR